MKEKSNFRNKLETNIEFLSRWLVLEYIGVHTEINDILTKETAVLTNVMYTINRQ